MDRRRMLKALGIGAAAVAANVATGAAGTKPQRGPIAVPDIVDTVVLHEVRDEGGGRYVCSDRVDLLANGLGGPAREDWLEYDAATDCYALGNGHHVPGHLLADAVRRFDPNNSGSRRCGDA